MKIVTVTDFIIFTVRCFVNTFLEKIVIIINLQHIYGTNGDGEHGHGGDAAFCYIYI